MKEIKAAFQKVGPIQVNLRSEDQESASSDRPKTPSKGQSLSSSEGTASPGPPGEDPEAEEGAEAEKGAEAEEGGEAEEGAGAGEGVPVDLGELVRIVTV